MMGLTRCYKTTVFLHFITGNGGFLLIFAFTVVMGTDSVIDKLSGCFSPKMEPSM